MYNDSYNMREQHVHVQRVLMMVCLCSEERASELMEQAQWQGAAAVGTWEKATVCDPRSEVAPEPQVPKGPGQTRRVPQLFTATAWSTPVVPPQVQQ